MPRMRVGISRRTGLLLAAGVWMGLGLGWAAGCSPRYSYRQVRTGRVPSRASIAVTVWAPHAKGTRLVALEGYLAAALLDRGLVVKTMRPELLLGRSNLVRLLPAGVYSSTKGLATGLRRGGALQGDPKLIQNVLARNELTDATRRLEGLFTLAKEIPESWGVKYLLVVHQFGRYGYAAYTVYLPKQQIVGVMVVSGDREGFVEALGGPGSGRKSQDSTDGDISRLELLRLAEHVARFVR